MLNAAKETISCTVKDRSETNGKQLKFNLNKKYKELKNEYHKRKDLKINSTEVTLKDLLDKSSAYKRKLTNPNTHRRRTS